VPDLNRHTAGREEVALRHRHGPRLQQAAEVVAPDPRATSAARGRQPDPGFALARIIPPGSAGGFYGALRELGEARLAEVQQIARAFVEKRGRLESIDKQRLIERIRAGDVIVLDVRPAEEYRAAHIAGAVSLPLKELEKRLGGLPADQDVVAYCRGPYCVLAPEAVQLLRARGYRAMALGDGVAEWRAQGLPVAVGDAP
jgi:rhodanese-related sulfurtransferase